MSILQEYWVWKPPIHEPRVRIEGGHVSLSEYLNHKELALEI